MGVSVDVSDLDTSSLRGVYVFSLYIFCLFHRSVIGPALQPVQFNLRSIGGSISLSISHLLVAIVAITGHPLAPAATAALRLDF
jgi:hypothetical protein